MNSPFPSKAVQQYLRRFTIYYPEIISWYNKVEDDFRTGQRRVMAIGDKDCICGLAILRFSKNAKLCHFSVAPGFRGRGIGSLLWRASFRAFRLANVSSVHVTTSEFVYEGYGRFFASLGFKPVGWEVGRYTPKSSEIVWSLDQDVLWSARNSGDTLLNSVSLLGKLGQFFPLPTEDGADFESAWSGTQEARFLQDDKGGGRPE